MLEVRGPQRGSLPLATRGFHAPRCRNSLIRHLRPRRPETVASCERLRRPPGQCSYTTLILLQKRPRDPQRPVQRAHAVLRAAARPVAAPQLQPAQQRQRRQPTCATPMHPRPAAPARRRIQLAVQLRQPPRRAVQQPVAQTRLEVQERAPLPSIPRQRSRNAGDDASSSLTSSARKLHRSLRSSASRANIPSVIVIPSAWV